MTATVPTGLTAAMTPEAAQVVQRRGYSPTPRAAIIGDLSSPAARRRRGALTAIYYLLRREVPLAPGEECHRHWVHPLADRWNGSRPMESEARSPPRPRSRAGERPHRRSGKCWQAARPLGEWVPVACTVAPAFEFGAFDMAPPGWEPGR